ncbi:hypothetical protein OS493_029650 [Desmophyllum pertusum]|uniref:Uncharacterized protein n=1 Tax=Desmophyllum pertusum TaxID=174260 RepID=A0A9X0D1I9_9CNID|nr:hypothetical protein OS493_029650 [Desmophyllum pertusum]
MIEFLSQAKKHRADDEISSVKSRTSRHSRHSITSSSSSKSRLIEAKAKAAALEVKAAFLKEKQALRMAAEELDLRQEIAQAKLEEKIYEQYDKAQNTDGIDDDLEIMKVKYTSTPISFQACDQVTLSVASTSNAKPQSPAVVNTVSTVSMVTPTPSTIPISTSAVFATTSMDPGAQPFIPGNSFAQVKESVIPPVAKQPHNNQQESAFMSGKDSSSVVNESTYQEFLNVQRKQNRTVRDDCYTASQKPIALS